MVRISAHATERAMQLWGVENIADAEDEIIWTLLRAKPIKQYANGNHLFVWGGRALIVAFEGSARTVVTVNHRASDPWLLRLAKGLFGLKPVVGA